MGVRRQTREMGAGFGVAGQPWQQRRQVRRCEHVGHPRLVGEQADLTGEDDVGEAELVTGDMLG